VVRLDGVDHHLGPYGSEASHQLYECRIVAWRLEQIERSQRAPSFRRKTGLTADSSAAAPRLDAATIRIARVRTIFAPPKEAVRKAVGYRLNRFDAP